VLDDSPIDTTYTISALLYRLPLKIGMGVNRAMKRKLKPKTTNGHLNFGTISALSFRQRPITQHDVLPTSFIHPYIFSAHGDKKKRRDPSSTRHTFLKQNRKGRR
jgi:hypothetical protein